MATWDLRLVSMAGETAAVSPGMTDIVYAADGDFALVSGAIKVAQELEMLVQTPLNPDDDWDGKYGSWFAGMIGRKINPLLDYSLVEVHLRDKAAYLQAMQRAAGNDDNEVLSIETLRVFFTDVADDPRKLIVTLLGTTVAGENVAVMTPLKLM